MDSFTSKILMRLYRSKKPPDSPLRRKYPNIPLPDYNHPILGHGGPFDPFSPRYGKPNKYERQVADDDLKRELTADEREDLTRWLRDVGI
jgi:hypothetical protein